MRYVRALGVGLIAAASIGLWPPHVTAQVAAVAATAEVRDAAGRLLATAALSETPDQVMIGLTFPDPAALTGTHAIQIHEVGRCDPPDFTSAGSIFNPFGKEHGLRNPAGPTAGDVPSLVIGPNGVTAYNTSAPLARLSPGPASLLRQDGTSLVIFAQADDDQTQPEGNPGARIACGVIQPASPSGTASLDASGRQPATNRGDPDLTTAALIAVLGALLIGAGVVLRRAPSHP